MPINNALSSRSLARSFCTLAHSHERGWRVQWLLECAAAHRARRGFRVSYLQEHGDS
jgi:hypothetical protein